MLSLKLHMKIQVIPEKQCYLLTQQNYHSSICMIFHPSFELSYEIQTIQMLVIMSWNIIYICSNPKMV